ncbi:MAG TPA: hypothetical protein VGL29_01500 [Blastocatellia bacterium]
MKLLAVLLAFLSVIAAGQTTGSGQSGSSVPHNQSSVGVVPYLLVPKLNGARLKGNKLIVTGQNFTEGATILTGDIAQISLNTRNDPDSPSTTLIAKKGGKYLPFDQYFGLTVQNPNGEYSFFLDYLRDESFWALALPGPLYPYPVNLKVGDYLVVPDLGLATTWFGDSFVLTRVFDLPVPSSHDWLFQVVRPGVFRFYAEIAHIGSPTLVLYNNGIVVNGEALQ